LSRGDFGLPKFLVGPTLSASQLRPQSASLRVS